MVFVFAVRCHHDNDWTEHGFGYVILHFSGILYGDSPDGRNVIPLRNPTTTLRELCLSMSSDFPTLAEQGEENVRSRQKHEELYSLFLKNTGKSIIPVPELTKPEMPYQTSRIKEYAARREQE
jgi:hypothetical protein